MAEDHLASRPLPPPYDGPHRLYDDEAVDPRAAGMPALQAMLFTWFHGNMLSIILRAIDRTSMAHGIEVRMPFTDWRGYTKRALRQAMHGLTPESIRLGTRKIGIISLTESWIRGPLRSWLFDLTASRALVESSVWNGSEARAAVERAVDGVASIGPVWPIQGSGAKWGGMWLFWHRSKLPNLRTKVTETYADSWRWRLWCE